MASEEQLAALASVVPAAQESARAFGVPASVTLAQWILESGWGQSKLALQCKNYFGVKAENLNVPATYREYQTAEYVGAKRELVMAGFEAYPTAQASFEDHARLLSDALRYRPAMRASADPFRFVRMLQICGYSTSPVYAAMLGNLIREHNLTQYDLPEPQEPAKAQAAA